MHAYLLSTLLGIVEGLTEFIPVSSTAHLRIAEGCLGIDLKNDYWKMYSVVIQLGAILSVILIYGQRLVAYAKTFPIGPRGNRTIINNPLTLVAIAFVVTAGPSYLLHKKIGENLDKLWIIATALLVGGVIMWIVDIFCTRPTVLGVDEMSPLDALWIGAVEILSAVFPGTSRSMSTIAAGQVFGLSRSTALDFSFLLSLPVMFAACAYEFIKSLKEFRENPDFIPADLGANPWVVLAIGFVVSFIIALIVNRWFLHWVKRHGFTPFAIYRIALGIAIVAWLMMHPATA